MVVLFLSIIVFISISQSNGVHAEIIIDSEIEYLDSTLSLTENITISGSGSLTLTNTTIQFNCSFPLEYGIVVEPGGEVRISDRDGVESTRNDASHLLGTEPFFFIAKRSSIIEVHNSFISSCGETLSSTFPRMDPVGLIVKTDGFSFKGTEFSGSYNGLYLDKIKGGLIENCTFTDLVFGIKADLAEDLVIRNCSFKSLTWGLYMITANPGIPSIPISGRIDINDCTFTGFGSEAILVEYPKNITVRDCVFSQSDRCAISFEGVNPDYIPSFDSSSVITGNEFNKVSYPVRLEDIQDIDILKSNFTQFVVAMDIFSNSISKPVNSLGVESNIFKKGFTGVSVGLLGGVYDSTISNNSFLQMDIGIRSTGGLFVSNNIFDWMANAGILHELDGVLETEYNHFSNSTFGIKAQRDLLFRPSLILGDNWFENNHVGLQARDISLTMGVNSWVDNEIAILLLGMEMTIPEQNLLKDCTIGIKLISSVGRIENLTFQACQEALLADIGTSVELYGCTFNDSETDATASNSSTVTLVDSFHANAFRINDADSSVRILWTSSVHLYYISDRRPARGIPCRLTTATGSDFGNPVTNDEGSFGPLQILQTLWKTSGPIDMQPYNVTVIYRDMGHTFSVRFEDEHWFHLGIDDVPPTIMLYNASDYEMVNKSRVPFTLSLYDGESLVQTVTILVDGRIGLEESMPASEFKFVLDMYDGHHTLVFEASDTWGNQANLPFEISVDTEPPVLTITNPPNGTLTNLTSFLVYGKLSGADRYHIGDVEIPLTPGDHFTVETPLNKEGLNILVFRAYDRFNNSVEATLHIIRDTTPPTLDIQGIPELTNRSSLEIRGTTDGVRLSITAAGIDIPVDGEFSILVELEEGSNEFVIEAMDIAGNVVIATVVTYSDQRLDFEILSPINGATVDEDFIEAKGSGEPGLRFRLVDNDEGDWNVAIDDGNLSIDLELPSFGQNIFRFEVEDPAGNTGQYLYVLNRSGMTVEPEGDDLAMRILAVLLVLTAIMPILYLYIRRKEASRRAEE
jgi:hypothetical protein